LECSFKPGQTDSGWPHLNPESAALAAKKSKAGKLALIHFDASRYLTIKEHLEAEKVAQKIFPNTIATQDELAIPL
jgi:ribonuclease BN (tRNA processing enzyme)